MFFLGGVGSGPGPYLVVLRAYSLLYTSEYSWLARGPYGMSGIKLWSAVYKAMSPTQCSVVLALVYVLCFGGFS